MTCRYLNVYVIILIVSLSLFLNGCTHSSKRSIPADLNTQKILSSIEAANGGLKTFKGLGNVKLINDEQESSMRLAWAGESPHNLRLIILVSGNRIESFAANEHAFYLKSYTGAHDFIQQNSSNTSLEKLVSIPISTNEVISLLSGKIPLINFKYATTIQSPDAKNYTLELAKPWWGVEERIFLDNRKNITGFEMLEYGQVLYSVTLDDYREVNRFKLPFSIKIESDEATCMIKISDYYTNPDVAPSMFTLRPD